MYKAVLKITKFTHFFQVEMRDLRLNQFVYGFTSMYTDWVTEYDVKSRRYKKIPRVWGGRLIDNSIFRFPINTLPKFVRFMKQHGVRDDEFEFNVFPIYKPAFADFKLNSDYTPYDYQVEAVEYSNANRLQGVPSVLIEKPPGSGKTVTFCRFLEVVKQRAGMITPATYVEKWGNDAEQYLNLNEKQIYTVSGSASISELAEMALAGEYNYDFTIISLRTFLGFIKSYETSPAETHRKYGTTPIDIWRLMQLGVLGGDESHEEFYSLYWAHTFFHGVFHLALSATMMDRESMVEERQKDIYPAIRRFDKIKMRRYISFVNVDYSFQNPARDKIKFNVRGKSDYSQHAFEKSILSNLRVRRDFLEMLKWVVEKFFFHEDYKEGDKLALYFFRLDTIEVVYKYLRVNYPNKDIRIFQGGKDYNDLMEPEIRVTNFKSAGTGKDIKGLTTVISFLSIDSPKANIQLLGRIREIKDRDVYFVQLNCMNSNKHMSYKRRRDKLLEERTKFISSRHYGKPLGG